MRLRLYAINAPELKDVKRGYEATEYLKSLLVFRPRAERLIITTIKDIDDKYNRILAKVYIVNVKSNEVVRYINFNMAAAGYAVTPFMGEL